MKFKLFKKLAVVQAAAMGLATAAHAALPAEVNTEIATAKTDMLTAIGLVIAAMVAVWALKKLGSKMGWI
jgi:flagellar biogenesis protein FliO